MSDNKLISLADEETWGGDFVDLCRWVAQKALLLENMALTGPLYPQDEKEFGSELGELMRRALCEARQKKGPSIDWKTLPATITNQYHPNVIDYLWCVAHDEMRCLGLSVPPQALEAIGRSEVSMVENAAVKSSFTRGDLIQMRAHAKETLRGIQRDNYREMQLGISIKKRASTSADKPTKK